MKQRAKVPLYQINLDITSNEAKNVDHNPRESNVSSPGGEGEAAANSGDGMQFPSTSSVKQQIVSAYMGIDLRSSDVLQRSEVRDQDTDPKHMEQNKSEQFEENNSNFSLDSIPSENNQNDDERDEKLRGHTTGRLPTRNIATNRGSRLSNYGWSRQSQGNMNGDNNSSNYLHTMECYQDSEDMDLTMAQGDQGSYSNQIMLTEGFPSTDILGARANSLIEMKLKRDSFEQGEQQQVYIKGSQVRNPRDYLVKKSQINLISQQDYPAAGNARTQKYPTMFKYLGNLNKAGGDQSASSGKKLKKSFKSKNATEGAQPLKTCSPSRYTNPESSFQRSSRRKAGKMISQITLIDDETQKVGSDDEQDQTRVLPSSKPKMTSKASEYNLAKSLAMQRNDSSYRNSDSKHAVDEISIRVSKIMPSESIKERTVTNEQRVSVLKEEDALNDTIDEIRTLNKSNKPKTHRSKCSSEFKKSMKMQPSQIIRKSNNQNKTPVMILKIDLQKNQKPQIVAQTRLADQTQSGSPSPVRREQKAEKQHQCTTKHEALRISTELTGQSAHKLDRKRSQEKKLSRENSASKKLQIERTNKSDANKEWQKPRQSDNNYQLAVNLDKSQHQMNSSAAIKKSQSKENLKINIQKVKESQSLDKRGKDLDRKEAIKSAEPQLHENMNSFKNKKNSEYIQYHEKRDTRTYEKKCLFTTTGQQQSEKKIRQNNSCQNIHSQSNYLQGHKIIQDVQRIEHINLNSSRHHKIQKSSLERIVGSNECLKLFDTIEKIKKTPIFHVKNLSLRKQSEQSNNNARGIHQRAMTSRQNTDEPMAEERSLGGAQKGRHDDYNPLEAKEFGMSSTHAKRFNLTKASYLNINRKKSQSPCAIQKTKKNLFIFSSEEIKMPRNSPMDKQNKSKLNDLCQANGKMSSQRGASAKLARQSGSRQPSKDNIFTSTTIKRVNVRISSQQSQNQSGLNFDLQKEKEHQSLEKRIGERTQSLKQFIIQQKKELFKARKQQSIVDEDEIKIGERTYAQAERQGPASSNQDRLSQNHELQEYKAVNEVKTSKECNKIQASGRAPPSPQKKSAQKINEKRGSPQKRVVQIDLHQDLRLKKRRSQNSNKDGEQALKASQASIAASQRQAADNSPGPYQDLVPIDREDNLSRSSTSSNVLARRNRPDTSQSMAGHILVDEDSQQAESQDEDPIEQTGSGIIRESEISTSQADLAASASQADLAARHSDIERQVHQKIKQILKEYREAIDSQENQKLQKLLKDSPDLNEPGLDAKRPGEPAQTKRVARQEPLEDPNLRALLADDQANLFELKRKTSNNVQMNAEASKSKIMSPPNATRSAAKKERQTWRKKATAAEEMPLQRSSQPKNSIEQIEPAIDLRNQIQLTSSSQRKSVLSSGQPTRSVRKATSEAWDHTDDSGNKERLSTIEFFLTQSNGGLGAAGVGSKIFLGQPSLADAADTLIKSDDFSGDGLKSSGSNVDEQQLIKLKQQLDKIAQAIDTGEEGDLESDNQANRKRTQNPRKATGNAEKLLKRKKKKDRGKKPSVQEHLLEQTAPFTPRQNQQYGYFLNPNDGQVSLVPISQVQQQQAPNQHFQSQASQPPEESSIAQNAQSTPLDLSGAVPQNAAMGYPSARQLFHPPTQQQQVVWMPVPITHVAPYGQGMPAAPQHMMANATQPLSSLGRLQTPVSMATPLMPQNTIQIQPFITGPAMVGAPTIPPQSPLGVGPVHGQHSPFIAFNPQQMQTLSQMAHPQLSSEDGRGLQHDSQGSPSRTSNQGAGSRWQ